jgi:hypothetical protein
MRHVHTTHQDGLPSPGRTRTYLTTRWWMPLVLFCIAVGGVFMAIMEILKISRHLGVSARIC